MFSAYDKKGNIIYAEDYTKGTECLCKVCGEGLRFRNGETYRPHFAHKSKSKCTYDDRDNKSPWHIRMQEYFPKESREYLFVDNNTGEKHIADVYITDEETVIEFQHSPITADEFVKRTAFHLTNKRRIVWVFDESTKNPLEGDLGRLRPDDLYDRPFPYGDHVYRWQRMPRKCIQKGPRIVFGRDWLDYSICIYSGVEDGDVLHRIIGEEINYEYVTTSIHTITMKKGMDVDEFFYGEQYWLSQPDWKPIIDRYVARQNELCKIREERQRQLTNAAFDRLLNSRIKKGRPRF